MARISLKLSQLRASLNTRSRRTPLNAERAPVGESDERLALKIKSTMESTTMIASKMLNESRVYSLKPRPISLITISKMNAQVKNLSRSSET